MESVKAVTPAATADGSQRKGPWWSGDPSVSPRCGAKTRAGGKCRAPAMWSKKRQRYTRCRMHGGASTGPHSEEGRDRCRRARWKHGRHSAAAIAERRAFRAEVHLLLLEMKQLEREAGVWLRRQRALSATP